MKKRSPSIPVLLLLSDLDLLEVHFPDCAYVLF